MGHPARAQVLKPGQDGHPGSLGQDQGMAQACRADPTASSFPPGLLSFTSTTVFGTPPDITLSELALETFFPADAARALQRLAGNG